MTRINAGSTLANQYAPPFVVSNNVTTNWQLRWNADLIAFEAFDPSENVIESGFDSIESALFTDVTQQVFVVPWEAASKESLFITIQGVKQQQDAYTISTNTGSGSTTITLGDTVSVETVEILGLQTSGGASIEVYLETAIAAQTDFPVTGSIGWYPASEQSLIVTLDGIKQNTTAYSILPDATFTGAQVILVTAPGADVVVEVLGIATAGETPASPVELVNLTPADEEIVFIQPSTGTKRVAGETQFFDIKGLTAGANITLIPDDFSITIAAAQITLTQSTGGTSLFNTSTPSGNNFRTLIAGPHAAGNRIALSVSGADPNEIVNIAYNFGYKNVIVATDLDPYVATLTERLFSVTNLTTATQEITLRDPSELPQGDTITVKDQDGSAGVNALTLTPAAGNIDGAVDYTISTAYGYITLYSDGTNYRIISEG